MWCWLFGCGAAGLVLLGRVGIGVARIVRLVASCVGVVVACWVGLIGL